MPLTDTSFHSLQLTEARARFDLLDVESYDVVLDLAADESTFPSLTTIRFTSRGGDTFLDLKAEHVNRIVLNGSELSPDLVRNGRLPLTTQAGPNELVVDAVMPFRNDGEGLHRGVDPADGRAYVYGMSFMDAAPTIFACFDQPDLKAPYTFHVTAPGDWTVIGNAPGERVGSDGDEPARWEFEPTPPLSTYFVTLVAGPYHVVHDEHDGIPLSLSCRQSIAEHLDADADELFTITKQCFDEFHRLFGIRYPFGNYHQAFVPEFNAGAMENPGCVTYRDTMVFTSKVTRGERIQRANTVAHEMAHQWFGNITTPKWWDDLWLNESFAEYMGGRVTTDATQFHDAWTHDAFARRQWGLVADQRPSTHPVAGNGAFDATAALQDFDGISYAKGSTVLRQLNARLGDEVFFEGVVDHFTSHRFGNATMADLFGSWQRAAEGRVEIDLDSFTGNWLRTAGPDRLEHVRADGALRRTPPPEHPAERAHTVEVAVAPPGGPWRREPVTIGGDGAALATDDRDAVLIDPDQATWALPMADATSIAGYAELLPTTADTRIRSGIWNTVRSAFHNAEVSPETVIDVAEAWLQVEDNDDALRFTLGWLTARPTQVADDPTAAGRRLHDACRGLLGRAEPGSTVQLAGFNAAVGTAADTDLLAAWLAGDQLPDGLEVDADLRWRVLVQLASLGAVDRAALDSALAEEPTVKAKVEHTRAVASMPTAEAKAWAWRLFTGKEEASNYELEAAGSGLWRPDQQELTAPYVERFFRQVPGTVGIHAGWVLGTVIRAFYPLLPPSSQALELADDLLTKEGLDLTVRRNLVDATDELRRLLAVRSQFGG